MDKHIKEKIEEFIERQRDFLERFSNEETISNLQWSIRYWRRFIDDEEIKIVRGTSLINNDLERYNEGVKKINQDTSSTKKGCGKTIWISNAFPSVRKICGQDNDLCDNCRSSTNEDYNQEKEKKISGKESLKACPSHKHAIPPSLDLSSTKEVINSQKENHSVNPVRNASECASIPNSDIHSQIKKEIDKDYDVKDDGGEK